MIHIIELEETGLFNGIDKSLRNLVVIKSKRTLTPGDTILFENEGKQVERQIDCLESYGLKPGFIAISLKEKEA